MGEFQILPQLVWGRGTICAANGGGACREFEDCPSTTAFGGGPPPRDKLGEDFGSAAARLAGLSGLLFGWTPDIFWRATPAELGALMAALAGEQPVPGDGALLARLKEQFPDG